jgi:hypothetical protein
VRAIATTTQEDPGRRHARPGLENFAVGLTSMLYRIPQGARQPSACRAYPACFLEAGVSAGYSDCKTKAEERKQIRNNFASGEYQVVWQKELLQ